MTANPAVRFSFSRGTAVERGRSGKQSRITRSSLFYLFISFVCRPLIRPAEPLPPLQNSLIKKEKSVWGHHKLKWPQDWQHLSFHELKEHDFRVGIRVLLVITVWISPLFPPYSFPLYL